MRHIFKQAGRRANVRFELHLTQETMEFIVDELPWRDTFARELRAFLAEADRQDAAAL